MPYVKYSAAEKAAYYRRKNLARSRLSVPYNKVSGRGAYGFSRFKKNYYKPYKYPGAGARIGSQIGGFVGRRFPRVGDKDGAMIGKYAGQAAHSLVKTITGFGDYHVSKNSLVYNIDAVPEFSNNNERCTMICHREYITDIISSTGFASQTFRINPAIADTFPWLSSVAQNYEQYVVQGMVFEFKSTSATAVSSTNTSLGTVVMATQYNSLAPSFTNKQQMENYEFCQSSVPSKSILHPIECDPAQTQCGGIFNMYNPTDSSGDTRLYDVGKFTIATQGMQAANANIGELWVSYKICLLKPRLQSVQSVGDWYQLDAASVGAPHPLGDVALAVPSEYNTGLIEFTGVNEFFVDPNFVGVLQVCVCYNITASAVGFKTPYLARIAGNCSIVTTAYNGFPTTVDINGNPVYAQTTLGSTGANYASTIGYIQCDGGLTSNGSKPRLTITNMNASGLTIASAYLSVIALPDEFLTDPFP